jgi:heat shock protein HtpX
VLIAADGDVIELRFQRRPALARVGVVTTETGMDLWAEPMTWKVASVLLAGLVTLFVLIALEIRSHARSKSPRLPKPPHVPGAVSRAAVRLGLIVAPFTVIGLWFGTVGAAVALGMAIAIVFWSLRLTGPAILAQCGARLVTDRDLVDAVQDLAAKAGIPAPRLLEIQESHPNAFALGSDPAHAAIVVTLGLRTRLTGDELRAVMGHEISHIAHRDTLRATIGVTLMSAIAALALRLGLIGLSVRRQGGGALLFLAILAPLSALVLRLAASRSRDYQADREGALLCGNPDDLIRALSKLDASTRRVPSITANDQPALAALFIVNPLPHSWVGRLFAGHPPVSKRIERLRAFSGKSLPVS